MDKRIIVEPLKGIDEISFGISREEVRKYFGNNFEEFKKSKFSKNTTDDYGYCHIFYDKDNKFEAIEFFDEVTIIIDDIIVFPNRIEVIKKVSDDFEKDEESYISKEKSIGIYAPNDIMESILLGMKGYYE
jgi:hypothetical protein